MACERSRRHICAQHPAFSWLRYYIYHYEIMECNEKSTAKCMHIFQWGAAALWMASWPIFHCATNWEHNNIYINIGTKTISFVFYYISQFFFLRSLLLHHHATLRPPTQYIIFEVGLVVTDNDIKFIVCIAQIVFFLHYGLYKHFSYYDIRDIHRPTVIILEQWPTFQRTYMHTQMFYIWERFRDTFEIGGEGLCCSVLK